jgi:hypothetical protein
MDQTVSFVENWSQTGLENIAWITKNCSGERFIVIITSGISLVLNHGRKGGINGGIPNFLKRRFDPTESSRHDNRSNSLLTLKPENSTQGWTSQ